MIKLLCLDRNFMSDKHFLTKWKSAAIISSESSLYSVHLTKKICIFDAAIHFFVVAKNCSEWHCMCFVTFLSLLYQTRCFCVAFSSAIITTLTVLLHIWVFFQNQRTEFFNYLFPKVAQQTHSSKPCVINVQILRHALGRQPILR